MSTKKQVWIFQFRRSDDEDYIEVFDRKPSRKFLDKMLMEDLLPDTFSENNTTPSFERTRSLNPLYYEMLYTCEINEVAVKNEARRVNQ